jgi:hypothetical protein
MRRGSHAIVWTIFVLFMGLSWSACGASKTASTPPPEETEQDDDKDAEEEEDDEDVKEGEDEDDIPLCEPPDDMIRSVVGVDTDNEKDVPKPKVEVEAVKDAGLGEKAPEKSVLPSQYGLCKPGDLKKARENIDFIKKLKARYARFDKSDLQQKRITSLNAELAQCERVLEAKPDQVVREEGPKPTHEVFDASKDPDEPWLNLRMGPSTRNRVVGAMMDGTPLIVHGREGRWLEVEIVRGANRGTRGFANGRWIRPIKR